MGSLAAATLAAAEPMKDALRSILTSEYPELLEHLVPVLSATVVLGSEDVVIEGTDLGRVDLVSGGAIVQALLHAVFHVSGIRGVLRVIEPDRLDPTNLNRYLLALLRDVGLFKTQVIAACAPPGIRVIETRERLAAQTLPTLAPLAGQVVVGTDNLPSRWLAQSARPPWLAVGATSHFLAMSSEHAGNGGCARCVHPRDDGVVETIPTASFTSYWAGLMLAARLFRQRATGACPSKEQAKTLWTLHLDGKHSQHSHAAVRDGSCPLRCAAA
jgi:hypothetical protein